MRKIILISILIFGTMGNLSVFAHGVEEETKGKAILEKLEAKETNCESLTDEDFEALGEYFMGQIAGDAHPTMNTMMEQMMGKEGEEQMHIVMGKRMSGCDLNAQLPQNMMMGMMSMGEGGFPQRGFNFNNMMNQMMNFGGWGVWGWFGWIFMVLFWVLIIVGIVALIKWLIGQTNGAKKEKTALDILKERFAKGEISKEEFEEKSRLL